MTGLRRRVSFGFISIVGVLILSGMVSYFELSNLSRDTEDLLGVSRRYKTLATKMYDILREHNVAFVEMTAFDNQSYDSLCMASLASLEATIYEASIDSPIPDVIDTMALTASRLREVTERFVANNSKVEQVVIDNSFIADTLAIDSLVVTPVVEEVDIDYGHLAYIEYNTLYNTMIDDIERYVAESQIALAPDATHLRGNAYRVVTPVLISLIVMIAIVLMLFFFVITYCVTPLIKINKALKDYLAFKIPFAPKGNFRDEMQEICERIDAVIKLIKFTK